MLQVLKIAAMRAGLSHVSRPCEVWKSSPKGETCSTRRRTRKQAGGGAWLLAAEAGKGGARRHTRHGILRQTLTYRLRLQPEGAMAKLVVLRVLCLACVFVQTLAVRLAF